MNLITQLAAAAGLAALSLTALPSSADAQHHGHRWNGPEGHFLVYVRSCPDLREDRRDRRVYEGRRDVREDRRDRRVIECPRRAWEYVPSRRELRQGRTGQRLRPTIAYLDRRSGQYFAETRWGGVPVYVVRGRAPGDPRRGRGRGNRHSGWHH
jgi:phytoene/squalene synthetase